MGKVSSKGRKPAPRGKGKPASRGKSNVRRMPLRARIALLTVIVGVLSMGALTPARQAYQQRQVVEAEEQRLVALKKENSRLQERLNRLSDPEYLEKLAREEFGVVRPGEIAYVINPPPPPAKPKVPAPALPWYGDAWKWVSGTAWKWVSGTAWKWVSGTAWNWLTERVSAVL